MNQPLVIFDFDGVLVDSENLSNQVLSLVLTELGVPLTPVECHTRFTGMKLARVRQTVEKETARPLSDRFEEMIRKQTRDRMVPELEAVPGAADLLSGFRQPRCIASNSSHAWIRMALDATEMRHHFEDQALFSAADVAEGKPAPDLFLHAASTMDYDPTRCVVVEDSILGVTGAVAAGMTVFGFAGASHIQPGHEDVLRDIGAVATFDDLSLLPEMLAAL